MKYTKKLSTILLLSLILILSACGSDNTNASESEPEVDDGLVKLQVLDESNPDYVPNELRSFQSTEQSHYDFLLDFKKELEDDISILKKESTKERPERKLLEYSLALYEKEEEFLKVVKQKKIIKKTRKFIESQSIFNDELSNLVSAGDGLGALKLLDKEFPALEKDRERYLKELEKYLDKTSK